MKAVFSLLLFFPLFALSSCASRDISIVDKIYLNASSMSFNHRGAELAECGLVSQVERGRSSSTNAGGSGCAACSQ